MSHYTVAVITKTNPNQSTELESLLAPFDENIEVEPYLYRTREQIINDAKEIKEGWIERLNQKDTTKEDLIAYLTKSCYKSARKLLNAETDEDFYNYEVSESMVGEDGNEYSTYNPNSKWDWWCIGGRWSGSLLSKVDGTMYDTLQIKDWDYDKFNTESIEYYKRFWQVAVEGAERTEEEKENGDFLFIYKPEYYLEKYGSMSNYIKCMCTFSTYAVLTPDGEWLAPGRMGWWGISCAEVEDEFKWERDYIDLISTFNPEYYVTIVDCHI